MVGGLEPPPEAEEARAEAAQRQGVVFVLEGASLETAKVGKVCPPRVLFFAEFVKTLCVTAWCVSAARQTALSRAVVSLLVNSLTDCVLGYCH